MKKFSLPALVATLLMAVGLVGALSCSSHQPPQSYPYHPPGGAMGPGGMMGHGGMMGPGGMIGPGGYTQLEGSE